METLIRKNFEYFNEHLLNNFFIFTLNSNKSIIVKVEDKNLAHLLGIKYSTQNKADKLKALDFYKLMVETNKLDGLYDLIDFDKDQIGELSKEENFVKEKNKIFTELFDHLLNEDISLRIYKVHANSEFDTDYLHVKVYKDGINYGYIGIKGEETSNYFRFNSIYTDSGRKYADSADIKVKSFKFLSIDKFHESEYIFQLSPRNKTLITKKEKIVKFKLDKQIVSVINRSIKPLELKPGPNGKGNFQLRHNKTVLISSFEKNQNWSNKSEIIDYVKNNYKDYFK